METIVTETGTRQEWRILHVEIAGQWAATDWETFMGTMARLYEITLSGLPSSYMARASQARQLAQFIESIFEFRKHQFDRKGLEKAIEKMRGSRNKEDIVKALEALSGGYARLEKYWEKAESSTPETQGLDTLPVCDNSLIVRRIKFASPGLADLLGVAEAIKKLHEVLKDLLPVLSSEGRHASKMRTKERRLKDIEIKKEQEKLRQMRLETIMQALNIVDKARAEHALEDLKHLARFVEEGKITSLASFAELDGGEDIEVESD